MVTRGFQRFHVKMSDRVIKKNETREKRGGLEDHLQLLKLVIFLHHVRMLLKFIPEIVSKGKNSPRQRKIEQV